MFRFRVFVFLVLTLLTLSPAPVSAEIVDIEPICHHQLTITSVKAHGDVIFTLQGSGTHIVSYDASDPFDLVPLDTLDIGGPYAGPTLDESGGQLLGLFRQQCLTSVDSRSNRPECNDRTARLDGRARYQKSRSPVRVWTRR
jgi:hypothetical protein